MFYMNYLVRDLNITYKVRSRDIRMAYGNKGSLKDRNDGGRKPNAKTYKDVVGEAREGGKN